MSFGEYIDYWYRNFCEISIAETTKLKYQNEIYKHIIPGIGKIPLTHLKKSDLEKFYAEQMKTGNLDRNGVGDKKLSGAVIRSMHTRIKSALDQAQKEGLVNRNEAVGCKLPPKKNKEVEVLSHDEMRRLLIQANAEGFYEMILLALASGLRRGELLGLRWEDINFETCELSVKREYTTLGSEYIVSTPKTKASVRNIKIPQSVVRIFEEYRKTVDSEWVFPSPLDKTKPRSPTSCRSKLSDLLERAGCKHIPFHGLRHIFATNGIENGMDIKTLSAILGHSSAETTIGTYGFEAQHIYRGVIDADQIIAYLSGRNEFEIVQYNSVRDIEELTPIGMTKEYMALRDAEDSDDRDEKIAAYVCRQILSGEGAKSDTQ